MTYKRIILEGYTRIQLNGCTHFDMKMNAPLQLFLGTNGCGKSSLMWEISPLPADSNDFLPNGSKTVEMDYRGQHYMLASIFAGKPTYSFICNGEELNKGGTITVQKDLVREHFKIDADIHDLQTGRESFVSMNPARRKEWFLRLCDVNYDYALKVFNQLKSAHRDRSGAIRLEKKALVVESEKLLQEQEIARIEEEAHSLHECLSVLLEQRKPVETDLTTIGIENDRIDKSLYTLANNFTAVSIKLNERELGDADLVELIAQSQNTIIRNQAEISILADLYEKASQKIKIIQSAGEQSLANLESRYASLLEQEQLGVARSFLGKSVAQPAEALSAFTSVKEQLVDIFSNIPNNVSKQYSQASLLQAREALDELGKVQSNVIEKISERKAALNHMSDHMDKPDTTCPKCAHQFSLVYSEQRMAELKTTIEVLDKQLREQVKPKIEEKQAYIEQCNTYARLFRQFHAILSGTPILKPYWDHLLAAEVLTSRPSEGLAELMKIDADLQLQMSIAQIHKEQQEVQTNLQLMKSVGDTNLADLQAQNLITEKELDARTTELQTAQAQNNHYRSEFSLRKDAQNLRKNIRDLIAKKRGLLNDSIEHERRTILNQLIREMQSALASREHLLFAAKRQKETVDLMGKKIEQLIREEQALAILIKELSPTEGLIAEGILGFIKNFCDQMNELIEKIWSYPLTIQSCEVIDGDGIDLDYKFPMIIGDQARKVSDISKGSTGMQEVINLAFKLIAMQYLDLQDAGLYLDEIGANFDKDHRTAAATMIRALLEENAFSQVFMISHYQGLYGALSNAEVCVLDSTNILVPKEYNTHVNMY